MQTEIASKSELASMTGILISNTNALADSLSSLKSTLSQARDYDGIDVTTAANILKNNLDIIMNDVDIAAKNIKNYEAGIESLDTDDFDSQSGIFSLSNIKNNVADIFTFDTPNFITTSLNNAKINLANFKDKVTDKFSMFADTNTPLPASTLEMTNNSVVSDKMMGMLYNQYDYADIPYGGGGKNLASSGCGFFSTLSAVTAKTGHKFSKDEIANIAATVSTTNGLSNQQRMELTMKTLSNQYNFTIEHRNGDPRNAISNMNDNEAVIFLTRNSGHFVALTNKMDNGNVIINDSDGALYNRSSIQRDRVDNSGFNLNSGEFEVDVGNHWVLKFNDNAELTWL